MGTEIGFRKLAPDDLSLVFDWRRREHVRAWWSGIEALEDAERKYLPRIEGDEPTAVYLILLAGKPIGLIQTYLVADYRDEWPIDVEPGVAGVDLFIGEEELVGRGLGPRILQEFVDEVVFANPSTIACVAGPDVRNHASIRAFEKAGFVRAGIVDVPGGEAPELLLRLDRSAFPAS
jgi:RimJ/RimL family protein N-acetyltransferase